MKLYIVLPIIFLTITKANNIAITPFGQNQKVFTMARECKIHNKNCPWHNRMVVIENLPYTTFNNQTKHNSTIIVLDSLAPYVIKIFQELYQISFPIEGIDPFFGVTIKCTQNTTQLIAEENYNYTGSYSCRNKTKSQSVSMHSYGAAIDINPLQNPYILFNRNKDITYITPKNGNLFVKRSQASQGMITAAVIKIFSQNGFPIWGGSWRNPKDYHHFEILPNLARILIHMQPHHSATFFAKSTEFYNKHGSSILKNKQFKSFLQGQTPEEKYQQSPIKFMSFVDSL